MFGWGEVRLDIVLIRVIFVIVVAAVCYFLQPFGLRPVPDVVVGLGIGLAIILPRCDARARVVHL